MSVRITQIAFVYHRVTDIVRARDFYERVLGMKVALEYEGAPGKWWIEYEVDGIAFAITNVGQPRGDGGAVPVFEVADVEAAVKALQVAGVMFVEPLTEYPRCRSFMVTDPDGNQIGFHQLKPAEEIPKFVRGLAEDVTPYIHAPSGRTVAHRQPDGHGHIHLFSPTGFYVATESEKRAEPIAAANPLADVLKG
jgi:predicted enzyme related to lactoylglutathione lyase